MNGYSPILQEVYPLAVPRQRTDCSDSYLLAIEVVQLPILRGSLDQAFGQVEVVK